MPVCFSWVLCLPLICRVQEDKIINVRTLLTKPVAVTALLVTAPIALASGDLVITGLSLLMRYYESDTASRRNFPIQGSFESHLDDGQALGSRRFDAYQEQRIRRSRPYGSPSDTGYRYRSQPAFGLNLR